MCVTFERHRVPHHSYTLTCWSPYLLVRVVSYGRPKERGLPPGHTRTGSLEAGAGKDVPIGQILDVKVCLPIVRARPATALLL